MAQLIALKGLTELIKGEECALSGALSRLRFTFHEFTIDH